MEKKNYQTPTCLVVELKPRKILMTSIDASLGGYSTKSSEETNSDFGEATDY